MLEVEAEEGGIEWEDPRIQSWSGREENVDWLKRALATETQLGFIHVSLTYAELSENLTEIQAIDNKAEKTESGEESMVKTIQIDLNQRPAMKTSVKSISEVREEASRDEVRLRKELEETKPDWMKEWETTQKKE